MAHEINGIGPLTKGSEPLVSVIVPVFNVRPYIDKAHGADVAVSGYCSLFSTEGRLRASERRRKPRRPDRVRSREEALRALADGEIRNTVRLACALVRRQPRVYEKIYPTYYCAKMALLRALRKRSLR